MAYKRYKVRKPKGSQGVGLAQGQNNFTGGCSNRQAWLFCKLMEALGKGEHRFPLVARTDRYVILDNITQPRLEEELSASILYLPGHTEDSIGLVFRDGSLFCGDAAMNGFPSTNRITIWIENLDQYIKSWELMISINPKRIYPAHGKPFIVDDLRRYIKKANKRKLYPLIFH